MELFLIRREQMNVLAAASKEQFEENIMAHLRRVWPDDTASMSDDVLLQWVRYGVARGERYDIDTEFDVARFLDVMFLFDPQFDENPTLPWAAEILQAPHLDGRQRVDALMTRAMEFCDDLNKALED